MTTAVKTIPCPTCDAVGVNGHLRLKISRYGLFYGCTNYPECTSKVGAHQDSGEPLGVPGDEATREARIKAHEFFDLIWTMPLKRSRGPLMTRKGAYCWMAAKMGLSKDQAHIGKFTREQCEQLIQIVNAYLGKNAERKRPLRS